MACTCVMSVPFTFRFFFHRPIIAAEKVMEIIVPGHMQGPSYRQCCSCTNAPHKLAASRHSTSFFSEQPEANAEWLYGVIKDPGGSAGAFSPLGLHQPLQHE
jgi:hypothetical protein